MLKIKTSDMFAIEGFKGEILIGYSFEQDEWTEECHGIHYMTSLSAEITSVEVVIGGKGVEILPLLSKKQLQAIEDQLSFTTVNA